MDEVEDEQMCILGEKKWAEILRNTQEIDCTEVVVTSLDWPYINQ